MEPLKFHINPIKQYTPKKDTKEIFNLNEALETIKAGAKIDAKLESLLPLLTTYTSSLNRAWDTSE